MTRILQHKDDGGSRVLRYRMFGRSINSTCSTDETSPLYNVSCTYYFDYDNCTTAQDTCQIPGLRRATMYYVSAAAINMMGEGPNMTSAGYPGA